MHSCAPTAKDLLSCNLLENSKIPKDILGSIPSLSLTEESLNKQNVKNKKEHLNCFHHITHCTVVSIKPCFALRLSNIPKTTAINEMTNFQFTSYFSDFLFNTQHH